MNHSKKIVISSFVPLALILASVSSCSTLSQVPVYEGMTVKNNANSALFMHQNSKLKADENRVEHDDTLENDIEDIVDIEVTTDDEVKYYVEQSETFLLEVHLDNPNQYEIQSFTLNGKKYSNYMFEDGSDLETLLLEVTAPATSGYTDLSIDAIKYIDGTEIKDVDMSKGDKNIKIGVNYDGVPSATLESSIVESSRAEFNFLINDANNLTKDAGITLYLSDGVKVVSEKTLNVGSNKVTFDNLLMNKAYEFGISTAFDAVDGNDYHQEWLLTGEFVTQGALSIVDVVPDKKSVKFDLKKINDSGEVTKITLYDYDTGEVVSTVGSEVREFNNLLSNHKYRILVDYTYYVGDKPYVDWSEVEFTTKNLAEPTLNIENVVLNNTDFSADLFIDDPDSTVFISNIELLSNDKVVSTNKDGKIYFDSLAYFTDYVVRVTYTVDLNDGKGATTKILEYSFKTPPFIEFVSCEIKNTTAVSEGETIFLDIKLDNPSGGIPEYVVINGEKYECIDGTTKDRVLVDIVYNGQFDGGLTTLTINQIIMSLNGQSYETKINGNNKAQVFINGALTLESITTVDSTYKEVQYYHKNDEVYLKLNLNNKTGYEIYKVIFENNRVYEGESLIKISNNEYVCKLDEYFSFSNSYSIKSISYKNEYVDIAKEIETIRVNVYVCDNEKDIVINTREELEKLENENSYVLGSDIDLFEKEWKPYDFIGVLNGKGHTIKNLGIVKTIEEPQAKYGLFSEFGGLAYDLTLENFEIVLSSANESSVSVGSFASGLTNYSTLKKIDVVNTLISVREQTANAVSQLITGGIGGLISGGNYNDLIIDCKVSGGLSTNVSDFKIGGIAAHAENIYSCVNEADIYGKGGYFGGIAGSLTNAVDCLNYGEIHLNDSLLREQTVAGGIVADTSDGSIENCINYGLISSKGFVDGNELYVGGVVGRASPSQIINCINNGNFEYEGEMTNEFYASFGGILGKFNGEGTVISGCVNNGDFSTHSREFIFGAITADSSRGSNYRIENCINNGDAYVPSGCERSCNMFGSETSEVTIENCTNNGKVYQIED